MINLEKKIAELMEKYGDPGKGTGRICERNGRKGAEGSAVCECALYANIVVA